MKEKIVSYKEKKEYNNNVIKSVEDIPKKNIKVKVMKYTKDYYIIVLIYNF